MEVVAAEQPRPESFLEGVGVGGGADGVGEGEDRIDQALPCGTGRGGAVDGGVGWPHQFQGCLGRGGGTEPVRLQINRGVRVRDQLPRLRDRLVGGLWRVG